MRLCGSFFCATLLAATLALLAPPVVAQASHAQAETFATADDAVKALVAALRADKPDAIEAVLGPASAKLVNSGDKVSDAQERQRFLSAYDQKHQLVAAGTDRMAIQVGPSDWPLPIPLVRQAGSWSFDTQAGAQELLNRRIGRNEIAAIRTLLACADAEKAYLAMTGQYTQRLVSSPGNHDGLYWPAAADQQESPLAPLVTRAQEEGYPDARVAGKPVPYNGYFFRILLGQGTSAQEGALDYVHDGRMTGGFALIAWPASFGASGIMSFLVNQDGIVFQKDLGPATASGAAAIKLYDPDLSWARVDIAN